MGEKLKVTEVERMHFDSLLDDLSENLEDDPYWEEDLTRLLKSRVALHLAILHEPYLGLILEGKKTIETRLSVCRQAPYKQIAEDDVILLKKTSGPIVGLCRVSHAWFYELDQNTWRVIKDDYFKEILVKDQRFWERKKDASFASLIRVRDAHSLDSPVRISKRDRRAWVVLIRRNRNGVLF